MKLLTKFVLLSLTGITLHIELGTLNSFAQCLSSVTPKSPNICKGNSVTLSATAISNNALQFDGMNDYVNLSTLKRPSNTFTVEAWFKTSVTHEIDGQLTSGVGGIAGQKYLFGATYANPNDAGMGVSVGTNGISVYEHSSNYMPATAVYTGVIDTGWNHLAVVYTNKTPSIYLNGVLVKTGLASPRTNVLATFQIGGDGSYGYFNGKVDEVRIWNVARTQTEISSTMKTLLTGYETGLASYWRLDEGNGIVTNDATVNHTTATFVNGPVWVKPSTSPVVYTVPTYSWMPTTGLSDTTGNTVVAKPDTTTTYTIIGKGSCGSDTTFVTVTVNLGPSVVITGTTALCKNGTSVLTAFTPVADTTYKYKWNTGDSTSTITAKPDSTTSYWVAVSNQLCTDTATATVQLTKVTAVVTAKDSVLCKGENTTLTASGGTKYIWNTGNSKDTTATLMVTPLTTTTYSVKVFNCVCPDSAQVSIKVNPLPSVNAEKDTTLIAGGSVSLSASGNSVKYLWTPSTGLSKDSIFNPTAKPAVTTVYVVTGTDANNCSNKDSVTIIVKDSVNIEGCKEFFIPNAFSPNNNGFNDSLYVRGCLKEVKEANFAIYDRWGKKVFETSDLNKGWDGTSDGKTLNTAVFVYYLKATLITDDVIEQKGSVSLIR